MAWDPQATSHYLNQCWPKSMSRYGVTMPQWVKWCAIYIGVAFSPSMNRITINSLTKISDHYHTAPLAQRGWGSFNGPLTRYLKLRDAHAPGMPGTFPPPSRVSDPDMHHGTCVTHVPWSMPGSLISGFLWNRWRGKRSRHSRRMRNTHFYVSGKRPMRGKLEWEGHRL